MFQTGLSQPKRFLTSWNSCFWFHINLILNDFWVVWSPFWRRGRQCQRDLQWRLPAVTSLSSGRRIWTSFRGSSEPVKAQFESLLWILCSFSPAHVCLGVIHCSRSQTVPWLPEHQGNNVKQETTMTRETLTPGQPLKNRRK